MVSTGMNNGYIITSVVLGEGGFSTVYKGYNKNTGEAVAVKKPTKKRGKIPLQKELDILKKLPSHENIIKVLDYYESDKNSYIVLELCQGQSLDMFMRKDLGNAFGVKVEDFHNALLDISAGYKHLKEHRFAHRDIKPDNVMISFNSNGRATYKLADLGCAKRYLSPSEDQEDTVNSQESGAPLISIIGTPGFMDPYLLDRYLGETTRSKWSPSKKKSDSAEYRSEVDMWSIGCTLVYIACNCAAFIGSTTEGLIELHTKREPSTLMGSNNQGKVVLSDEFREVSPIKQKTSETLKSKYKEIVRACFKPLEDRSADEYFKLIEDIRSLPNNGLCYKLDITQGYGYYDLNGNVEHEEKTKMFSLKAVEHLCQALKVKVPVIFACSQSKEVAIARAHYNVVVSDPIGSQLRVIKSQCEAIRCIVGIIERTDFDIMMLKHLGVIVLDDKEYNKIEEDHIDMNTTLTSKMYRQYSDIMEIFKDIQWISRTAELASLQAKCQKIEEDFIKKLSQYRKIVYGRKGEHALLHVLCTGIMKNIVDCGALKNKVMYGYHTSGSEISEVNLSDLKI